MSKFYKIQNADGKCWWMPVRGMRVGLALYQPSGWKGRMLKRWLPWLHWSRLVRKALRIEKTEWVMPEEVRKVVCEAFGVREFDFAVFGGKLKDVLQVWDKKNTILGYCKITKEKDVFDRFVYECDYLKWLDACGVTNIPKGLYVGELTNGLCVFVQDTTKKCIFKIDHFLTEKQVDFIRKMNDKTKCSCRFEDTDFAKSIDYLVGVDELPDAHKDIVLEVKQKIVTYFSNNKVEFAAYHADFTPWNSYVQDDELYVFDFEYSKKKYPKHLDLFHYITQIALLEKHLSLQGVYDFYLENKNYLLLTGIDNTDLYYVCYLMDIISFYFKINNGKFDITDKSYVCWIGLLEILNSKITL